MEQIAEQYINAYKAYQQLPKSTTERQRFILQGYLTGLAFALDKLDPHNEREMLLWEDRFSPIPKEVR